MEQITSLLSLEDSVVGFALISPDTRVIFANPRMRKQYDFIEGEMLPKHSLFYQVILLSIQHRKSVPGFPIYESREGEKRQFWLMTQTVMEDEALSFAAVIVCDLSPLYKSTELKRNADKLKIIGDMAAGTANVMLNPLTVIKGSLQMIEQLLETNLVSLDLETHPIKEKLDSYFSLTYEQVRLVDERIRKFLLLGKPADISFAPISVVPFLQKFVPAIQLEAVERSIVLRCEYPGRHGILLADEQLLFEALKELVQNAYEAVEEQGIVIFKTEVTADSVEFFITDNGSGLSANELPQVKEPFYTTKEDRVGLGLNYCESIVNKLNGKLEMKSTPEGTCTTVIIPILRQTVE